MMTDEDEDARNEEGRAMTDEGQRPTTMKNDNGETIIDEDGDARTTRRHRGGARTSRRTDGDWDGN